MVGGRSVVGRLFHFDASGFIISKINSSLASGLFLFHRAPPYIFPIYKYLLYLVVCCNCFSACFLLLTEIIGIVF